MKLVKNKLRLYAGLENDELYKKDIFKDSELKFTLDEIILSPIKNLNSEMIKKCKPFLSFSEDSFLTNRMSENPSTWLSSEGLKFYAIENDIHIYMFSFGEKQPGLYLLFLEFVLEKQEDKYY